MAQSTSGGYRPHVKMDLGGQLTRQGTINTQDSRLQNQYIPSKIIKEEMKWLSNIQGTGSGVRNYKDEIVITIFPKSRELFDDLVQLLLDKEILYTCFEGCVIMKKEDLNTLIYE